MPLCNPNKYSHTQGNRAGTLAEMEQNRPFSREQNHRGEEACGAYWYSLQLIFVDTDALPLRAHTAKREENQRGGGSESDREHIFDCSAKSWPNIPLLLSSASHSCLCGHSMIAKTFLLRGQTVIRVIRIKEEKRKKIATEFEVLSFLND